MLEVFSLLNNINARGISKHENIKVLNHLGATSEDLKDFINPTIRRKPNIVVMHIGTNDITENIDTISNLQNIVKRIKKKSAFTTIAVSSVVLRHDKNNIEKAISKLNNDLEHFCDDNLVHYVCNDNIDESCLGKAKLHPNNRLAINFANFIENST